MWASYVGWFALEQPAADTFWTQLGGVSLSIAVGFWLIRRADARSDSATQATERLFETERQRHYEELEQERAAHQATRELLMKCLREEL